MNAFAHMLVTLLVVTAAASAQASTTPASGQLEIRGLRVGLTPERTRMVFDISGAGSYRLMQLQNPARIAIDFPDAAAGFDHRAVALGGTPVMRIRSAVQPDGKLRYVFDLSDNVDARVFALKPNAQAGDRVVLDLYRQDTVLAAASAPAAEQAPGPQRSERQPPNITPDDATRVPNPVSEGAPGEWSGSLSLQSRLFFQDPAYPRQDKQNASIAFEPEYFVDWQDGRQRFAFRPFMRYDANDDERTHADLRELYWRKEHDKLVFKAGVDVVFWGVTESQHLVDILNQTDLVENIDEEDRLGQPMLNLDYLSDGWGSWQFWVLPYFRERSFPGERGRLRTQPFVDSGDPLWESGDEERHVDYALRWSHYLGDWDIGLAHFTGTGRTPWFVPGGTPAEPTLRPLYLQIDQTSLDVQATKGAWLWKLEAIYNSNSIEDYFASVGGFEYTWFGAGGAAADLGWLLEYHYDERGENPQVALQNDLFAGLRLTGNDIAGSRLLAGFTVDLDNGSTFGNVEAVRRIGESWTITLEARTFFNTERQDPLHFLRRDDYLEVQLDRFF
ncbi:MAG: AMIN domain-containing protein [Halioglobus sp.]